FAHLVERNLVGTPKSFDLLAFDLLRTGPAFRTPQDDERPARRLRFIAITPTFPRQLLNRVDIFDHLIEDRSHALVHWGWVRPRDRNRFIAVAPKQTDDFVIGHSAEDGGIGDLVTVEMQDGQDGSIRSRIKESIAVPRCRERAGLRLAVAHDARDDQVRVVECRAVRVGKSIAEFPSFMNGARRFRRRMARNSTWE